MAQKSIQGNEELARKIKQRRNELDLTIEEAALKAGVGTKTWSRYEAGESIRADKCKGICKALNWHTIPDCECVGNESISIQEYRGHEAWSSFLENGYGAAAAVSFAVGSDILLDHIKDDMSELARMPVGTHIGQLSVSWLVGDLPEQFLMHYDYEFLHLLKCTLCILRDRAKAGVPMIAHTVLEELLLYLCSDETSAMVELDDGIGLIEDFDADDYENWVFDMFDDMDIITCLYSNWHLDEDHIYHFLHWTEEQFYMD